MAKMTPAERATAKRDMIEGAICTAGYVISYWASHAAWDDELETYIVTEAEDEIVYVLTYKSIWAALKKIAGGKSGVNNEITGYAKSALKNMDGGDIDGDLADCMIQIAAFDELVYG